MTVPNDRSYAIAHHVAVLMYHDTGHDEFEANARTFAELWEELVPEQGRAKSVQGEILRAVGLLAGEDRRDGCVNWGKYYEELVDFLRAWLPNKQVFDATQRARILKDLDAVVANGREGIDYEVIRTVFGRLVEDAVSYCRTCPKLVPIEQNSSSKA
jgi:hypothetical protein